MPSSNSTANLGLNQWNGSDKPKMEDYNADNRKIDAAVSAHTADAGKHLAADERTKWNAALPAAGFYTGNGAMERLIDLGFAPVFGMVFAINKNIVQSTGTEGVMTVYSAFLSPQGCSQGAFAEESGFTVLNAPTASAGRIAKLNENGVTYAYLAFH